jgi:hypothetical protein
VVCLKSIIVNTLHTGNNNNNNNNNNNIAQVECKNKVTAVMIGATGINSKLFRKEIQ